MGTLTLNALECIRILAASEHGVSELMKNDEAMHFATRRCDSGDARIAECACGVSRARVARRRASNAGEGRRGSRRAGGGARVAVALTRRWR